MGTGGDQTQSIALVGNSIRAYRGVIADNGGSDGGYARQDSSVSGNSVVSTLYGLQFSNRGYGAQAMQSATIDNNTIAGAATAVLIDQDNVLGGPSHQTVTLTDNVLSASQATITRCTHGTDGQTIYLGTNSPDGSVSGPIVTYCNWSY